MVINDPRGEIAASTLYYLHRMKVHGYCGNAYGLHGLPQHGFNPLDILTPDSLTFHSDSKYIIDNFIALPSKGDDEYFAKSARRWTDALLKFDCLKHGYTSLPRLYSLVNQIEGNPEQFQRTAEAMASSGYEDIAQRASEILFKQDHAEKEFSGITGAIYNALDFMSEPNIVRMLEGSDFSLSEVVGKTPVRIYFIFPVEFIEQMNSLIRLCFSVAMLYKQRKPKANPVLYLIDEAAQLRRFSALETLMTYGGGAGNRAIVAFQDAGQITRLYGSDALSTFIGNAGIQQYFGIRDYQSARTISNYLGTMTLSYDDPVQQRGARRARLEAVRSIIDGEDPFYAAHDIYVQEQNMYHQQKQARLLLTPDEILNLPPDRQIIKVEGMPPILAYKKPYYERRDMAGKYMPNPYHPPEHKVRVRKRFWSGWAKVKTSKVPSKYRKFPQFSNGIYKYVKGY